MVRETRKAGTCSVASMFFATAAFILFIGTTSSCIDEAGADEAGTTGGAAGFATGLAAGGSEGCGHCTGGSGGWIYLLQAEAGFQHVQRELRQRQLPERGCSRLVVLPDCLFLALHYIHAAFGRYAQNSMKTFGF